MKTLNEELQEAQEAKYIFIGKVGEYFSYGETYVIEQIGRDTVWFKDDDGNHHEISKPYLAKNFKSAAQFQAEWEEAYDMVGRGTPTDRLKGCLGTILISAIIWGFFLFWLYTFLNMPSR